MSGSASRSTRLLWSGNEHWSPFYIDRSGGRRLADETVSPVVLFRAVPRWRRLEPADAGTVRQQAIADLQL